MSIPKTNKNKEIMTELNQSAIPRSPLAYFWYVSKPFKWWATSAALLAAIGAVLGQSSAYFFKLIIDAVEAGNHESALIYALLYPAVTFIIQLFYRGSGICGSWWFSGVKKYGHDALFKHTVQHSHSYFSDRFAGSLLSKIGNVSGAVEGLIPDVLWTYIPSFFSVLVTIGFLVSIDVRSTLVFVALIAVLIVLNMRFSPRKTTYAKASALAMTSLRARLVDNFSNIQAVRQYARSIDEEVGVAELSTEVDRSHRVSWAYTEWMLFCNGVVLLIFSLAMFWFLVIGWKVGDVSTGNLILILALYSQIAGTLVFIGRAFNSTARAVGEMEEGLEDLLVPYEIVDAPEAQPLIIRQAEINWSHVDFKFDGKSVFTDFNLNIPAGQRLGLVGQSGAGKTTFVSLLLRQHDIESGAIEIDDQDISQVTQDSLRQNIAVVPQEPALFHRSIKENILYGNPNATEEEMVAVAKKAQAHEFIMELTDGYETMVGERGVKLSGGQKQRVAIARAMLKDAPILVLDEATSALDSESEVAIQQALEALMEGRTVIAIAHRLSTLRKMDRIIVLDKGQITEDGAHDELASAGGVYEKLWNHQAGGFLQDD